MTNLMEVDNMNKLDRYDARKIIEIKKKVAEVFDYNYYSGSSPLEKKLTTIYMKLEDLLDTELEPELQKEWKLSGRI